MKAYEGTEIVNVEGLAFFRKKIKDRSSLNKHMH
jgi:hypothetical protein